MNKLYFFITLISFSIFAGEADFVDPAGPQLNVSFLAPGNGDAITQAEWEIAEAQQKEAALQAKKERPKRMALGAVNSLVPRRKAKEDEACSPCCKWTIFYTAYAIVVVATAGFTLLGSYPILPRDNDWCIGNVAPLTACTANNLNMNPWTIQCYPQAPICKLYNKQL